jgi:hypothetical protein
MGEPISEATRAKAVRALLTDPDLVLELFDRAVREGDPHARRIVRDYLRVVSTTIAEQHRTHPRP